jgi:hypothetical protein
MTLPFFGPGRPHEDVKQLENRIATVESGVRHHTQALQIIVLYLAAGRAIAGTSALIQPSELPMPHIPIIPSEVVLALETTRNSWATFALLSERQSPAFFDRRH